MVNFVYNPCNVALKIAKGNGVIKANEFSALKDAHSILAAAEKKAAEITEAAHSHYKREEERGYLDGLGRANKEALARLVTEQSHLQSKLREIEQDLADLLILSLRKILANFSDLELAEATAHSAMHKMRRESRLQFHLPPSLVADFAPVAKKLEAKYPEIQLIELVEDSALKPPNIVLESPTGRIECNLDTSLNALAALIDTAVTSQSAEPQQLASGREVEE